MKKYALLPLLFALLLCGFGLSKPKPAYHVAVASDLHYLSPTLTDHGAFFTALTENADGKLMRYIEEIADAFLSEMEAERPEALLLTGDLSFNGARESHRALAEKLRRLEAAGVPVLVLPGNHDLNNPSAAAFSGEGYSLVPSVTADQFRQIYRDFGYAEALSADDSSLSYVYPLNETTRVLMLDYNTPGAPCGISEATLRWVGAQLDEADRAGASVLVAGHQNLFQHSIFRGGYVIDGAETLAGLLRAHGVPLCLSGHLHCQHWKTEEGLTEIATSALSVSPCHYGILRADGDGVRYEARATDVSAYARAAGETDPALLDFAAYAADYFDARTRRQTEETLSLLAYTEEEAARMTDFLVALNRAYFRGDLTALASLDPDGTIRPLWDRYPMLYGAYLSSVWEEFGSDFRIWSA